MFAILIASLARPSVAAAQSGQPPPPGAQVEQLAKQAQNPVSSLISVPLEANWDMGIGDSRTTGTLLKFQPVMPFGITPNTNVILRVIMPLTLQPATDGQRLNGVGDVVMTAFFSPAKAGRIIWDAGPVFLLGEGDPLFLQVKEARASVLERYAGASVFPNHGQRIVDGYRRMQPASDIFLGWSEGPQRHFFIRQLRDMKISLMVETFGRTEMEIYAEWCGKSLALSHARSGLAAMISGYLGKSDAFDRALAAFSIAYANQNEKDHAALKRAVRKGRVKALFEET
jgi:hypothetical protein